MSGMLTLASNSPRRKQLLSLGNWIFSISVSDVDESQRTGETPRDYVLRLAEAKARASTRNAENDTLVIGADTAVVDGDTILGKPRDAADAEDMLRRLRGHTHRVFTGLALYRPRDGRLATEICITDVPMRAYTDEEISAYILSGDPLDKAGAYAIQHPQFQPVESMRGCYASVMGLPLCHLMRALKRMEMEPDPDIPTHCQSFLNYQCPVSAAILRGEIVG